MSREVMQQVLKTLKRAQENFEDSWIDAIAVIEAELDRIPDSGKMVGPEPVLFIHPSTLEMASAHVGAWKPGHELPGYIALYTSPPQRQPLMDEELYKLRTDAARYRKLVAMEADLVEPITIWHYLRNPDDLDTAHDIKEQIE